MSPFECLSCWKPITVYNSSANFAGIVADSIKDGLSGLLGKEVGKSFKITLKRGSASPAEPNLFSEQQSVWLGRGMSSVSGGRTGDNFQRLHSRVKQESFQHESSAARS